MTGRFSDAAIALGASRALAAVRYALGVPDDEILTPDRAAGVSAALIGAGILHAAPYHTDIDALEKYVTRGVADYLKLNRAALEERMPSASATNGGE